MAGLAHNPRALNCVKNNETDPANVDFDAVCAYCEKNSPELMANLASGTAAGHAAAMQSPDAIPVITPNGIQLGSHLTGNGANVAPAGSEARQMPPFGQFLKRCGIEHGAVFSFVMCDGQLLRNLAISDVAGFDDREAALWVAEEGTDATFVILWSKISSFRIQR